VTPHLKKVDVRLVAIDAEAAASTYGISGMRGSNKRL
jgi:hypothetical protein